MSAGRRKKRGARTAREEPRRWVVDSIEEEVATVEEDGERIVRVPRWMLPDDAREGSVLSVMRVVEGETLVLRIEHDPRGEAEALERSRRQVEIETGDEGGDVVL